MRLSVDMAALEFLAAATWTGIVATNLRFPAGCTDLGSATECQTSRLDAGCHLGVGIDLDCGLDAARIHYEGIPSGPLLVDRLVFGVGQGKFLGLRQIRVCVGRYRVAEARAGRKEGCIMRLAVACRFGKG